jgi:hypothetical protein
MGKDGPGAGKLSDGNTIAILADVVKARILSSEQIERGIRTPQLRAIKNCRAKLTTNRIANLANAWRVQLGFLVTVNYIDRWNSARASEKLLHFEKAIPFPTAVDVHALTPKVRVTDLSCEAFSLLKEGLESVLVVVSFDATLKGIARQEVTLLLPPADR